MKKYFFIYIIILIHGLLAYGNDSCILDNSRTYRQEYLEPQFLQSEHFVIHFTISENDFQSINGELSSLQSNFTFAQSILDLLEISLTKYVDHGWELPPPDCDESITDINSSGHCINYGGNSLYDVYLANDGVGMVVPETPYSVYPYLGGYTSFMKMSTMLNQYSVLPTWAHHVVAHELHHSIQLRYGYSTTGSSGNYIHNMWFFEQTASYMENVVFPYTIHLRTMLTNCNVVTPLTFPEHGIDYPAELYPYRSALWHKFLVESQGDSSIVRLMWEGYGEENINNNPVSLFPIYDSAIREITNDTYSIADAYQDYAIWRYFTGSRSISEEYFNEASHYCTSKSFDFDDTPDNSIEQISFSNKGGASYISLPIETSTIELSSPFYDEIKLSYLKIDIDGNVSITDLEFLNSNQYFIFNSPNISSHTLIIYSIHNNNLTQNIDYDISILDVGLGDANFDQSLDILDVVLIVNFALGYMHPTELEFEICDINLDESINILDVVQLINIILS